MTDSITLLMILHNHQPVGNFDWVFRDAALKAYIPFLDVLDRFKSIKVGIHTTGPLLEWFVENEPSFLDRMRALVAEGRVELLGGGFYEPILSSIPDRDKEGQLELMNAWLERHFGRRPEGFWVAERIWEPYFAGVFARRGLRYTALDNTHFQYAGLDDSDIWGSYNTDDQGETVRVLPIDYNLRYLIPFHEPEETIEYIGALKDRGVTAVTYADDGEKFGSWPGTNEWVYKKGWLERFFTALEANAQWINIVLPGDYVRSTPPRGRVYLPTASYREMMEWALPVSAQVALKHAGELIEEDERLKEIAPFIRGGFWRNFFTKYPESNTMYRRMIQVSGEVEDSKRKKNYPAAVRELYMAQCNCGYWHGVFGGLYLNFLRRAIYEHLIKAENLIAPALPPVSVRDHLGDGFDDVVLASNSLVLFLSPRRGGGAFELDYRPGAFNLLDTFTRRPEIYHLDIPDEKTDDDEEHASIHEVIRAKESGMRRFLVYDWYRRIGFVDHFLGECEDLERFAAGDFTDLGDFVLEPFTIADTAGKPGPSATLVREGGIFRDCRRFPMTVTKRFSLDPRKAALTAAYSLAFPEGAAGARFACELNLGLQSGYTGDSGIEIPGRTLDESLLASTGVEENVDSIRLTVGWMPLHVAIGFSRPATLWRLPVETVSQSEEGAERTYQNTCLVPVWSLDHKNGRFDVTITMEVSQ